MGPSALSPALRSHCTVTPRSAVSGPSSHHSVWAVGGGHAGLPGSHRPRGCLAGLPPPPSGPRPRPASAWPPQRLSPTLASAQAPLLHLSSSSPANRLLAPAGQLLPETSSVPLPPVSLLPGATERPQRPAWEALAAGLCCTSDVPRTELLRPGPRTDIGTPGATLCPGGKNSGGGGQHPSQGPLRAALPRGPSPATREGGPRGSLPFLHPGRLQPPSPPPGPALPDQQQTRDRLPPRARQPGPPSQACPSPSLLPQEFPGVLHVPRAQRGCHASPACPPKPRRAHTALHRPTSPPGRPFAAARAPGSPAAAHLRRLDHHGPLATQPKRPAPAPARVPSRPHASCRGGSPGAVPGHVCQSRAGRGARAGLAQSSLIRQQHPPGAEARPRGAVRSAVGELRPRQHRRP